MKSNNDKKNNSHSVVSEQKQYEKNGNNNENIEVKEPSERKPKFLAKNINSQLKNIIPQLT